MSDGAAGRGAQGAHGTGYEDAITRRIAGLESEARALSEQLERARAQADDLARDNAALRVRAGVLEARSRRGAVTVVLAITAAVLCAGCAVALLWAGGWPSAWLGASSGGAGPTP